MYKSYLKIAFRNLARRPGYTILNSAGLAVGIACCLLIALYVYQEWHYDRFHERGERIVRVLNAYRHGADLPPASPEEYAAWGSAVFGPLLEEDLPGVEQAVRLSGRHQVLLEREGQVFQEERYFFADPGFFDVFTYPLLRGDPSTALVGPARIVLAESAARRYFGDGDPMGQTLLMDGDVPLTVTGILAEPPTASHLDFDMLLSMETFEARSREYVFAGWDYVDFFTYLLLEEGADVAALNAALPAFVERHLGEQLAAPPQSYELRLEPLEEAYLSPAGGRLLTGPTGSEDNLYIFSWVAAFILLLACVNFMNLATARSVDRAKEVGVRKVVGAGRRGLVLQFLTESVLVALLSTALALILAELALPVFRHLSGRSFPASSLLEPGLVGLLVAGGLAVGLLSGVYPAFVLSRFQPAGVLKGAYRTSAQGARLRQGLVVFQFGTSVALAAATLVVFSQLDYLRGRDLGFEAENRLLIDFGHDGQVLRSLEAVKARLVAHPAVESVSATRTVPGTYHPGATIQIERREGGLQEHEFDIYEVGFDFLPQLGVALVGGRYFEGGHTTDSTQALVINAAAARAAGYANPADAVGQRFRQWGREGTIVGVTEDFHYQSLHRQVRPLTFRPDPWSTRYLVLHLGAGASRRTISDLGEVWRELAPHRPFLYSFLDDTFNAQYRADEQFGTLFGVFAGLALFIGCLGLFGLMSYATEQRTKEIGVRKVMGATVASVVLLLTRDVTRLVLLGAAAALPLVYLGMERWLEGFAYRTTVSPLLLLAAAALALGVAFASVAYRSVRAARANPVQALRYE